MGKRDTNNPGGNVRGTDERRNAPVHGPEGERGEGNPRQPQRDLQRREELWRDRVIGNWKVLRIGRQRRSSFDIDRGRTRQPREQECRAGGRRLDAGQCGQPLDQLFVERCHASRLAVLGGRQRIELVLLEYFLAQHQACERLACRFLELESRARPRAPARLRNVSTFCGVGQVDPRIQPTAALLALR